MAKIVILVLCCFLTAVLARDETSACRDVTRQTCSGFQQCCARKCAGAHETSCQESNGRISLASCECSGRGSTGSHTGTGTHGSGTHGSGHTGHGHTSGSSQDMDHSSLCRSRASGSCTYFKSCCNSQCTRPSRLTCSSIGSSLTEAICHCPSAHGSGTGSGGFFHTTSYPGSHSSHGHGRDSGTGSGGFFHTTSYPGSHSSHGITGRDSTGHGGSGHGTHGSTHSSTGLRETGEQDYTQTCARNYHDCTGFRSCCTNRCAGRNVQSQCQERGGHLTNTVCKCSAAHGF